MLAFYSQPLRLLLAASLVLPLRVAVAQCPDGTPPPCGRLPPVAIDSLAIAVLPFRVHGPPDVQYLSEGMVDLLQIALDGVGGFRVLYPPVVLRRLRHLPDPSDATRAASVVRSLGGGLLITGAIVATGPDLRVRVELHDAVRPRRLLSVDAQGDVARLGSLGDSVASTILAHRPIGGRESKPRRLQEYTTGSAAALHAFLVAEQLLRRGTWLAAAESLESALARDPGFGLAHWVLLRITGNRPLQVAPVVPGGPVAILQRGLPYLDRFPERARQLFLISDSYHQRLRVQALRLADEAARRFPHDAEAVHYQADMYFHFGLPLGEPLDRVTRMFQAALALDDGFPEAHDHYISLLAGTGDTAAAWPMIRHARALAPNDAEAMGAELAFRAVFRNEDPWVLARSVPSENLLAVARAEPKALWFRPDNLGRGVASADSFAAFLVGAGQDRLVRSTRLTRRHAYALAQGRYRDAWTTLEQARALGPEQPGILGRILVHALVTGTHHGEAEEAARRLADIQPLPLPAAAGVAWYAALQAPPESAASRIRLLVNRSWPDSALGRALSAGLRGLLAYRLGDAVGARALLAQVWDVQARPAGFEAILYPSAAISLTLAQLELDAGDAMAAKHRMADVSLPHEFLPFLATAEELRGAVSERLNDTAGARAAYRNVVGLLVHADSTLEERRARAQRALYRLGSE